MASRITRKPTALPVKSTAVARYVRELPGAVFFGTRRSDLCARDLYLQESITALDKESLFYAARLQRIRREYESDDCQEMLWHDLSQMGFNSKEISRFVTNPAAITNCGYGMPMPLQ
jgi:hypothetical protein